MQLVYSLILLASFGFTFGQVTLILQTYEQPDCSSNPLNGQLIPTTNEGYTCKPIDGHSRRVMIQFKIIKSENL